MSTMIKHLTKHGNSMALVIDKSIMEILAISKETPLQLSTDGQCLIVSPVRDNDNSKNFELAVREAHKRYKKTFKRLAE